MANITPSIAAVDGQGIATKATEVAQLVAGKPYVYGGKTTDGFDCSGFVAYVLKQLYPNAASAFETNVAGYMNSSLFEDVDEANRQPGDIIIFPASGGAVNHIGFVLDADHWIGSQSSTGVAKVKFKNTYWGGRTKKYRRLKANSPSATTLGRMSMSFGAYA